MLETFSHELAETVTDPFPTSNPAINNPEVGDPCEAVNPTNTWVDNIQVQEVVSSWTGQCVGYISGPACTYTTSAGTSGAFLASCTPDAAQDAIWIFKQTSSGWSLVTTYPSAPPSPDETILNAVTGTTETFVACYSVGGGVPDPYGGNGCDIPTTLTITGPDLLWWNPSTGALQAWITNDGVVTGTQDLTNVCTGCAGHPVDGLANSILWFDPKSGNLQPSTFNNYGNLYGGTDLSWQCTDLSSCGFLWKPLGRVTEAGQSGLLWYDVSTGVLSTWDLSGSSVTGAQTLDWTCSGACMSQWEPVLTADMNNDGNTDLVWFDPALGEVSSWLLDGPHITTMQNLSWRCTTASGCATTWKIIGAADVNGDGHTDLTWWNVTTGQISSWLLDGSGNVLTTQELTGGACSPASGCEGAWQPVGYVSFP
jgi:hypothetical protein